ncbi:MAG TPA: hypothetical protein V6C65_42210 [Allocoleopsis sp.]
MKAIEYFLPNHPTKGVRDLQAAYGFFFEGMGREGALYTIGMIAFTLLLKKSFSYAQIALQKIPGKLFPVGLDWVLESLDHSDEKELECLMMAIATLLCQGAYKEPYSPIAREVAKK